jgi:predicted transcriptional regulator
MTRTQRIEIGGTAADDGAAFLAAWRRAEAGDQAEDRVLAFESLDAFLALVSPERLRLLRHVRASPEPSVSALARALHRAYRRVHGDVTALAEAGLLDRTGGAVRATADRLTATADLRP